MRAHAPAFPTTSTWRLELYGTSRNGALRVFGTACDAGIEAKHDPSYSARRTRAAGVRAAMRPGRAATTLAITRVPAATRKTDRGTVGWGTA
jgi:hypothetical protein